MAGEPVDVSPKAPIQTEHLGDGAYVSFDGWYIWLGANDAASRLVALEPGSVQLFVDYCRRCGLRIK